MMPTIHLETMIAAPVPLVFDLSRSVDLHLESAAHTGERVIAGRNEGLFEFEDVVTWRARHLGIWQNLTVEITEMRPYSMFADEMVKGAFRSFRHVHWFEAVEEGTLMKDEFAYQSPLGVLGRLADWVFLEGYMRRFLMRRNAVIKAVAEGRAGLG